MRKLTRHTVIEAGRLSDQLEVHAVDDPGPSGNNHQYMISSISDAPSGMEEALVVKFQKGPRKESGVNGITTESLLVICIDQLEGFQAGRFACSRNRMALSNLNAALQLLQGRTRDRISRGVEGRNEV